MRGPVLPKILNMLTASKDMSIGVLLVITIMLMILPMPTPLVDTLIGINFGIAVLLLMTAIYLGSPLELSSLPGVILISTIFRLSLSVTTTRLILAEGDAGAIVETFGAFVIGGNVVVGMVVFFIVTIVQFIVIAKGSERIAEVGARFTLDAMPGKQMSIDAEMRNGDIDNLEAGRRRRALQQESQFYGAMDGAMKFVKGDAIAGLIVICVNLIGGLTIGMVQHGMSFAEAGLKYSLLTVGDALISQIPALLISLTAATIVTRVQGETKRNLGNDIVAQLLADKRALRMAAVVVGGMALLPGFPTVILLALAGLFLLGAAMVGRQSTRIEPEESETASAEPVSVPTLPETGAVTLVVAPNLVEVISAEVLAGPIGELRERIGARIGLPSPEIALRSDAAMPEDRVQIVIDEVPVSSDKIGSDRLYCDDLPDIVELLEVEAEPVQTSDGRRMLSVGTAAHQSMAQAGIETETPADRALALLEHAITRNFASFVGIQETQDLLKAAEGDYSALLAEVIRKSSVQTIAEIFRRLVQEGISLTNKRLLLEALAEWAAEDRSAQVLTEYVRVALKRQICHRVGDENNMIAALVLDHDAETLLRGALHETNVGTYLVLDQELTDALLAALRNRCPDAADVARKPVLITAMDIRRHLKAFLDRNHFDLCVLSFQEIAEEFTVVPVATISLPTGRMSEEAA